MALAVVGIYFLTEHFAPNFNLNNFKKKFGLKDLGVKTIRRYYSNGFRDSDYQDNLGNYFTAPVEYGNFSKGGYVGCVFNKALNFVKWLCGSKTHYFKDLDVGYNSLGGRFTLPRGTVDHVKPLCDGGTNDPSNLVGSCYPCNSRKEVLNIARFTEHKKRFFEGEGLR